MSTDELPPPRDRKELYERISRGGKADVIFDEMVRLGFWAGDPKSLEDPVEEVRRKTELRQRLETLRASAARLRNLAVLEAELKKQRMAESKRRREETKQRRLGERAAAREATKEKKTRELTYLGARVSAGLGTDHRESNIDRLASQNLPLFHSALELARAMGVTLGELRFLAFSRDVSTTTHYRRFTIPKRQGGDRVISAPRRRLKRLQHWILERVLAPLLTPLSASGPAHGFLPDRSIVSNAAPHVGADIIVNVDLRDFFPTVTYPRVKGLFHKLGYSEEVSTVLALLSTEPDIAETSLDGITYFVARGPRRLPQGAPTSPAITNLLCRRLDRRIQGWATTHGFTYTRYADDLTLSTKPSPSHGDSPAKVGSCLAFVRKVVSAEGFAIHPDKIRVVRRGRRQEVTGIVVNERLSVPRVELRKFRALLHHIEKDGPAGKRWGNGADVLASALGFASYVAMVDPAKGKPLRERVLALKAKYPR